MCAYSVPWCTRLGKMIFRSRLTDTPLYSLLTYIAFTNHTHTSTSGVCLKLNCTSHLNWYVPQELCSVLEYKPLIRPLISSQTGDVPEFGENPNPDRDETSRSPNPDVPCQLSKFPTLSGPAWCCASQAQSFYTTPCLGHFFERLPTSLHLLCPIYEHA